MHGLLSELVRSGILQEEDADFIQQEQRLDPAKSLIRFLEDHPSVSSADIAGALRKVFNIRSTELLQGDIDVSATQYLPHDAAVTHEAFPIRCEDESLEVAVNDPLDVQKLDELRLVTGLRIRPFYASSQKISECISVYYNMNDILQASLRSLLKSVEKEGRFAAGSGVHAVYDTEELKKNDCTIVRLVNLILDSAIKAKASDIHIEPQAKFVHVRFRVDGCLTSVMKVPSSLRTAMMSRFKIITHLDISECRKAQDGRAAMFVGGRKIDLRISLTPTFYGEKAVVRLLDPKSGKLKLEHIGLNARDRAQYIDGIMKPQGMVLLTGPTGCGKTSTLYATMNYLHQTVGGNIVTIEDPIEYLIDGVNQIQINPAKQLTFATALRSILRQDPNIILVGEIRDLDTAEIAFRSALTGHLVFSTLHTRNAVASITRLLDIGLEPYFVSSSLLMVVAQRLVRTLCRHCQENYQPDTRILDKFGAYIELFKISSFTRGRGCIHCAHTGFVGRKPIFEMLALNERIRELIVARASEDVLLKQAHRDGLRTLAHAGMEAVAEGTTTLEEVERVTDVTEVEVNLLKSRNAGTPELVFGASYQESGVAL